MHLGDAVNRPLTRTSPCEDWSLTSLKEKLIKIGAKIVSHGRYVAFQMAEVAVPRTLFADILRPRCVARVKRSCAMRRGQSSGEVRLDHDQVGVLWRAAQ